MFRQFLSNPTASKMHLQTPKQRVPSNVGSIQLHALTLRHRHYLERRVHVQNRVPTFLWCLSCASFMAHDRFIFQIHCCSPNFLYNFSSQCLLATYTTIRSLSRLAWPCKIQGRGYRKGNSYSERYSPMQTVQ